ncbi:MAG: DnaK-type molecular chaperone DnaK [Alphaproteobacteria bacterium]|nr:DnaK-type molecular chaperone DnaK [Alphaproteobacteria bacterium]
MHCGIDFGTSNTTMAVRGVNGPVLVPLENGAVTIPTALFYTVGNREILFGRAAVKAYLDGQEGRFMRSLKRVLGTSLMEGSVLVNGARTNFDVIIGRFLSHIRHRAEEHCGNSLTDVTIGRPVHFQDGNPEADARAENQLRAIAEKSGFKNIRFQYEPIAAALAHEKNVAGEKLALVIDIGGGTSDFSVIRLSRDYQPGRDRAGDILANTGVRIGGNDCDKAINLDTAMPLLGMGSAYGDKNLAMPLLLYHELSEWSKVNWTYTPQNINMVRSLAREAHAPDKIQLLENVLEEQLGHKILDVSENLKITLAGQENAAADFSFLAPQLQRAMTQAEMGTLLGAILFPVRTMMLETLHLAGVAAKDIAIIVLTGGSTGLPVFRHWVAEYFPHATVLQEDRLGSVGLGMVL